MAKRFYTKIDGQKLKAEIKRRGLTEKEISLELGWSQSYITDAIQRGMLRDSAILMLDKLYNIKIDDFVAEIEPEGVTEVSEPDVDSRSPQIDADKLYDVIYRAVYSAVKNAWMDE